MFGPSDAAPAASRLDALAVAEPGPAVMAELQAYDPVRLSPYNRVLLLRAWERQNSWVAAKTQPALVAVAGPEATPEEWGREEVAAALRISLPTAQRRVDIARTLESTLRRTGAALAAGDISYWHAVVLCEETDGMDELPARVVESLVLAKAAKQTVSELRRAVRRAVIKVDPTAADSKFEQAVRERCVRAYPEPDGMATLSVTLRADHAMGAFAILTSLAERKEPGDERTLDQRRADILVEILNAAADGYEAVRHVGAGHADRHNGADGTAGGEDSVSDSATTAPSRKSRREEGLPRRRRRRAQTNVTVDLDTLTGLADNPGYLDGYGAIPPALARLIAADSELRRFITDPQSGELLDRSPDTYRPSDDLAEFIRAKGRICPQPSCQRPSRRSDLHHLVKFSEGGKTVRANLLGPCERHHFCVHDGGWVYARAPDGTLTVTSPSGHAYEIDPQTHPRDG